MLHETIFSIIRFCGLEKLGDNMPKWLITLTVGLALGIIVGMTGTRYLARFPQKTVTVDNIASTPPIVPYPGMEFLYRNLEERHKTVLDGESCPGRNYGEQDCEAGQQNIAALLADPEYAVNFELLNFIAEHLGEPVYLRLFFRYIFDEVPAGTEFTFSLPGTNEIISPADTLEERYAQALESSSTNLLSGDPDRALGAGVFLEDPRLIINGINEVVHHPAGPVEIRGFFKFEELGQKNGVHFYRGRVLPVDLEQGLLTEKKYSNAYLMLGSVEYICKSPFIQSVEKGLLPGNDRK